MTSSFAFAGSVTFFHCLVLSVMLCGFLLQNCETSADHLQASRTAEATQGFYSPLVSVSLPPPPFLSLNREHPYSVVITWASHRHVGDTRHARK